MAITDTLTAPKDDVCKDAAAVEDKKKVMNTQWWNSLFYSATQILTFVTGILTAGAMGMIGPELAKGTAIAALAGATPVGVGFLAAAATAAVLATTFSMVGSRFFHSANFDQLELNAQHTAKYLVQEMKRENACVQEYDNPGRADGKPWAQSINKPEAAQAHAR